MWHLTQLALRNRLVTLVIVILIAGASIWAVMGIKEELIPNIEFPYTTVLTVYPQAKPDQVLTNVTEPLEHAIWDQWHGKGLKHLYSTSAENVSMIAAEFEYGTDMDEVTSTIRQIINQLNLPPEVFAVPQYYPQMKENPRIIALNMSLMPMVTLGLTGNLSAEQMRTIADTQVVPALQGIEGVLNVETGGGDKDQVIITPDAAKMNEYDISMAQIVALLAPQYSSLSDIENTSLGTDGVVLGNINDVFKGAAPGTVITRSNGKPSVTINVMKQADANTVDVAHAVLDRADDLSASLASGVTLETIYDQSDYIKSSVNQLLEKAVVGGVLAIIVVFLFLAAVRASLITAISIPLSLLIGFLAMRAFGLTINLFTLSAMSIAVGRLIDDSIVIVEVIYRRLQRGEGFREAAINGAREVANPVTSATLATVAIFIPLIFVGGIVGQLFKPFALTVTFAMLASLLVALMVVPALSNFLVGGKAKIKKVGEPWYQKLYTPILKWTLGHRALTLIVAVALFVGSIGLLPLVGTSFMSGMTEKYLVVDIKMPPGTDISVTSARAAQVEAMLIGNKEIKNYYTTVGASTSLSGAISIAGGAGDNTATITAYLKDNANMNKEAEALQLACQGLKGGDSGIAVSTSDTASGAAMGYSGVSVSVEGENQDDVTRVTRELFAHLDGVKGLSNPQCTITTVFTKLEITPDQDKMASLELSPEQIEQLEAEFYLLKSGGTLPNCVAVIANENYPIYIKGVAGGLDGASDAASMRIGFPQSISLDQVANVELIEVPTHIAHTDLALSARITGAITEKDIGAVNQRVQEKIDALPSHPGVDVTLVGLAEQMSSSFTQMGIAIIAAIVIAFLIVAFMMRSIIPPLIIMTSLPLAVIGALLALVITGNTIGMSAMMGMLMLVGIVLTNAIVLIALVEQLRKSGMNTHDALVQGGRTRLRPILMTALATIFAMIPLALGIGSGALLAAELAVVVIGGLFSSTLLTLVVVPVIYSLVDGWRQRKVKTT